MFIWCAYCQTFQGEKYPYDNYGLTHSICQNCKKNLHKLDNDYFQKICEIKDFFDRIFDITYQKTKPNIPAILKQAQKLNISYYDLLHAIIQPSLYKIGTLWRENKITIEEEHNFSTFVINLLDELEKYPHDIKKPTEAIENLSMFRVGVFTSKTCEHIIGPRIFALCLRWKNLYAKFYPLKHTNMHIVDTIVEEKLNTLALSISISSDLEMLEDFQKIQKSLNIPLHIALGGYFFRFHQLNVWNNYPIFYTEKQFIDWLIQLRNSNLFMQEPKQKLFCTGYKHAEQKEALSVSPLERLDK